MGAIRTHSPTPHPPAHSRERVAVLNATAPATAPMMPNARTCGQTITSVAPFNMIARTITR